MVLICHVISQDHVIKGSRDYWQKPLKLSYHSTKFGAHSYRGSGEFLFFVRQVILEDPMTRFSLLVGWGNSPTPLAECLLGGGKSNPTN